jgi:hypothetical protein
MSLVIDRDEGLTLRFKSDPLEKVKVSSSFDNVEHIKKFLQAQIEGQLRTLFADELPQIIHQLSLSMMQSLNQQQQEPELLLQQQFNSSDSMYLDPWIQGPITGRPISPHSFQEPWDTEDLLDSAKNPISKHPTYYPPHLEPNASQSSSTSYMPRRKVSRSHSQKWRGNEPVPGNESEPEYPRVLAKSLSIDHDGGLGEVGSLEEQADRGKVLSRENLTRLSIASSVPRHLSRESSAASSSNISSPRRSRSGSGFRRLKTSRSGTGSRSGSMIGLASSANTTFSAPSLISPPIRDTSIRVSSDWFNSPTNVEDEILSPVDFQPSDSAASAHLANLMVSNRTISLVSQDTPHLVLRADPSNTISPRKREARRSQPSYTHSAE